MLPTTTPSPPSQVEVTTSISNTIPLHTDDAQVLRSNWSDNQANKPNTVRIDARPSIILPFHTSTTPTPSTVQSSLVDRTNEDRQLLPDSVLLNKQYPNNNFESPYFSAPVDEYCPTYFARSLFWNWTMKGQVSSQKCPGGATGFVRWQCNYNVDLGISEWYPARPDFSECRSLWLDNLEERLTSDETVIRISNELAMMTLTKALYAEDLIRISHIVQRSIDQAMASMQSLQTVEVWHRHQVLKELLMFIVETISNILGNAQDDAWLDLSIANRKKVASSLIKSLENSALLLAENTNRDGSYATAKPNVCKYIHHSHRVRSSQLINVLFSGLCPCA